MDSSVEDHTMTKLLNHIFVHVLSPKYQEAIEMVRKGGYKVQCQIEDLLGMERNTLSGKGWTTAIRSRYHSIKHQQGLENS